MKDTDNKAFELTDEELAKVVGGGKKDVPTVTPPTGPIDSGISGIYDDPHYMPCYGLGPMERCLINPEQRVSPHCNGCYHNY